MSLFFTKIAGLGSIPTISLKRTSPQRFYYVCSARQLFLNHREIFCKISLQNIFWQSRRPVIYRLRLIENSVFDINIYIYIGLTFNSKVDLYCVKNYSYIRMPILMTMPRFSNSRFPGFCQFRMKKKQFSAEMKILHDFSYFLITSGLLTWFPITTRQTLLGIYMFKVDNKNAITIYETCL